tara:strand:- start:35590 stop:36984 length:1395 start_codon:yes stop_codon:yes gene_type:complete
LSAYRWAFIGLFCSLFINTQSWANGACIQLFGKNTATKSAFLNLTLKTEAYSREDLPDFKEKISKELGGKWLTYYKAGTIEKQFHYKKYRAMTPREKGRMVFVLGLNYDIKWIEKQKDFFTRFRKQGYSVYVAELQGQGATYAAEYIRSGHRNPVRIKSSEQRQILETLFEQAVFKNSDRLTLPFKVMGHSYGGQMASEFMSHSRWMQQRIKELGGIDLTFMMPGVVTLDEVAFVRFGWGTLQSSREFLLSNIELANAVGLAENYFAKQVDQFIETFPRYIDDPLKVRGMLALVNGIAGVDSVKNVRDMLPEVRVKLVIAQNETVLPGYLHFELAEQVLSAGGKVVYSKDTPHDFMELNSTQKQNLSHGLVKLDGQIGGLFMFNVTSGKFDLETAIADWRRQMIAHSLDWFASDNMMGKAFSNMAPVAVLDFRDYLQSRGDTEAIKIVDDIVSQRKKATDDIDP